jgi:hypothetical protein
MSASLVYQTKGKRATHVPPSPNEAANILALPSNLAGILHTFPHHFEKHTLLRVELFYLLSAHRKHRCVQVLQIVALGQEVAISRTNATSLPGGAVESVIVVSVTGNKTSSASLADQQLPKAIGRVNATRKTEANADDGKGFSADVLFHMSANPGRCCRKASSVLSARHCERFREGAERRDIEGLISRISPISLLI